MLLCHWKIGTIMYRIQEIMRESKPIDNLGVIMVITIVISHNFKSTLNPIVPKLSACQLDHTMKHNTGVINQAVITEKEAIMSWNKYELGDFISADQFIVKTLYHFTSGYGRDGYHLSFHGGTIF